MADSHSEQLHAQPRARKGRRWLKIVCVLLALVLILIALAPTLVSWGVANGLIRNAIAANIHGDVQINRIGASWLGGQRIEGLRIADAAGNEVADLSIALDNSLLSFILGRGKPLDATISGRIAATIRPDGSDTISDLLKEDAARPRKPKPARTTSPKPPRDAIPPVRVHFDAFDLALDDQRAGRAVAIDDLTGVLAYFAANQPLSVELHGKTATTIDGRRASGSLDIVGQADNIFGGDGAFTLRGAAAKLDVKASGLPLPMGSTAGTLESFALNLASDDLAERIAVTANAQGQIDGAAKPTRITIEGALGKIIDGSGKFSPRAATAHLNAEVLDLPIDAPASDQSPALCGEMRTLTATIVSEDLTQKIELAASGTGKINNASGGEQPSDLGANLALAKPFAADGAFTFALENLTGSASGTRVPTSLAQPMLAGLGVDAQRDLGATIDIEAFFPGGVGGDMMAEAKAPHAAAEIAAKLNADGSITGSKLSLHVPAADPALIAALTKGSVYSDRPLDVRVDVSSFHVPATDVTTHALPLGSVAASGRLVVAGPSGVRVENAAAVAVSADNVTASAATQTSAPPPPPPPPLLPLERIELNFDSPGLAQQVTIKGNAAIGGGTATIDQRLTKLINDAGALDMASARPEGTVTLERLPVETILAFAPAEHAKLIALLVGESLDARVRTAVAGGAAAAGLQTELTARTGAIDASLSMIGRDDGSLQFDRAVIDATISPALAAAVQRDRPDAIVLGGPAKAHLDLQPLLLPMRAVADVLSSPLSGKITLRDVLLENAPGTAQPLAMPEFAANISLLRKGDVVTATINQGSATIQRGGSSVGRREGVAKLTMDGDVAIDLAGGERAVQPNMTVRLAELNTIQAEALLGMQPGAIANWTGPSGSIDLRIESDERGYTARIGPDMPNLQGEFTATMRDELVTVTAATSRLRLSKAALQQRMNPPAAEAQGAAGAGSQRAAQPMIVVDDDVPMQVAISRFEFPMAMVTGTAFDPAKVQVDVALRGGPLKTTSSTGVKSTLSDLDLTVRAADISKGVQFALKGQAQAIVPASEPVAAAQQSSTGGAAPAANAEPSDSKPPQTAEERREARREERREERNATRPAEPPTSPTNPAPTTPAPTSPAATPPVLQPGVLDITGVLAEVINSEGKLDLANGRLQMNANADNVPTAVADALGDMQGMLVAAVGPQMNAVFVADDFSANTGTLDAKITTTNGSMTGLLRGRESSFRINKNDPLRAELDITPELRDRLLQRIHPILADVRTTEQPLRVEIPTALAAIPADVSKLRAEVNITVGKVELDSGSTTLKILTFFGQQGRTTIPGEIEPIRAQIRNGIVTYDQFSVHIDKYTLNYSGQIDLVRQEVDLRTEIPLKALNQDIPQLRQFAESIVVPLVTRGKFGALKTTIDPDFDLAKAAIEAGVKGGLGDLLKGDGGGLLDGILNRDKDKQPEAITEPPPQRPRRRDRPTTQPE